MSDVTTVLQAVPRILSACRTRQVRDPEGEEVSDHQARILGLLDTDDPTMVTELAEHVGVTASTMSLTLTRLERGGYIHKARDPADRRVMNVRLTERGEAVRDARTMLDPQRVDAMLAGMDPEARRTAVRGLARLAEAADDMTRRGRSWVDALTEGGELS